jgi:hypothetical protein
MCMKKLLLCLVMSFTGIVLWSQCQKGDCKNGYGELKFTSGNLYKGYFANGKKEGKGLFTWGNGSSYDGDWKNDKMEGNGTYVSNTKKKYIGGFANGKMHGKGTMYKADGTVENAGEWNDGNFVTTFPNNRPETPTEKEKPSISSGKYLLKEKSLSNLWNAKWVVGLNPLTGFSTGGEGGSIFANGVVVSLGEDITTIGLNASLGYFVAPKILVGGDFELTYVGIDGSGETYLQLHPYGKYFINSKFAAGAGISKVGDDWKLDVFGSYIVRLTNNISMEPTLHYFLVENSPIVARLALNYHF